MTNNAIKFAKSVFSEENIDKIRYINTAFIERFKIVVFIPESKADELTYTMASAGAGNIGKYSLCSYRSRGTGTFRGGKGTNPVIGKKGRFEKTDEVRLEMICDGKDLNAVLDKMLEIHPYEEPAYDIYKVLVRDKRNGTDVLEIELKRPLQLKQILNRINKKIQPDILKEIPGTARFGRIVINFTGSNTRLELAKKKHMETLLITRNARGSINIRLK
ncbi:MAG: hypothetical protein ABSF32_04100 [Ignavibacteria bacterium]|jgi:hypothetical protein